MKRSEKTSPPPKAAHIISDHPALDIRVFTKECRTLAREGYDVHLVVREAPAESQDGVAFHATDPPRHVSGDPRQPGLLSRAAAAFARLRRTYAVARNLRADVYHLHEPLLIFVGIPLKLRGARVIYDAHEDYFQVARRTLREGLFGGLWRLVAYTTLENLAQRMFDGIISATPSIQQRFSGDNTAVLHNYPMYDASEANESAPYVSRSNAVVYVGGISEIRGAAEMIRAMDLLPTEVTATLTLAGKFMSTTLEAELGRMPGWNRVHFAGWHDMEGVHQLLTRSRVGLVLFHPVPNHTEAQPNKLFEYMEAGIPVVASDFPLWQQIVGEAGCGLSVDPLNPREIAAAIQWLLEHPDEAERMGARGREAVRRRYNWEREVPTLLRVYERALT